MNEILTDIGDVLSVSDGSKMYTGVSPINVDNTTDQISIDSSALSGKDWTDDIEKATSGLQPAGDYLLKNEITTTDAGNITAIDGKNIMARYAQRDSEGHVITATYATKTDLNSKLNVSDIDFGTGEYVVGISGKEILAHESFSAEMANQDILGNVITGTYATKEELTGKQDKLNSNSGTILFNENNIESSKYYVDTNYDFEDFSKEENFTRTAGETVLDNLPGVWSLSEGTVVHITNQKPCEMNISVEAVYTYNDNTTYTESRTEHLVLNSDNDYTIGCSIHFGGSIITDVIPNADQIKKITLTYNLTDITDLTITFNAKSTIEVRNRVETTVKKEVQEKLTNNQLSAISSISSMYNMITAMSAMLSASWTLEAGEGITISNDETNKKTVISKV